MPAIPSYTWPISLWETLASSFFLEDRIFTSFQSTIGIIAVAAIAVGRPVTQPPPHTSRPAISPHQALQKYLLPQWGRSSPYRDAAHGQRYERQHLHLPALGEAEGVTSGSGTAAGWVTAPPTIIWAVRPTSWQQSCCSNHLDFP